jgi:hypothetical protein
MERFNSTGVAVRIFSWGELCQKIEGLGDFENRAARPSF